MRIAVGGDHAGFPLKGTVISALQEMGHEVKDFGSYDSNPVDFPDITRTVCEAVLSGEVERAVMVCGTGVGACIAANKIPGIRASVCHDIYSAHQCVEHDDVNVMCVGAQIIGPVIVVELLESFLKAEFSTEEEFRRRVEKLYEMERHYAAQDMKINE
ncbi:MULTISPECIES: RpiB/LacA/LacB family sugar-phosphate isomerase [Paenibacillus]|uniref:Ribose 5-phosphate isomerase n=1 Tax=Paenibacillus naphthalenovorans TaxID=162209 RepID=A0A0U2U2G4_9BACL|nr:MULTISPECIES: RpiB/LacA/LacB family sugar-phosphate isomerase [Paenibacillus]ALS20777.1 ribose 5-phosphate isomerase [Paenibacillus naphthalenovorans]NTZ19024.1 ribose 5-phosphate isomerase B [Paenibacillus sp. JMULE4]GCL70806.1 ribose 5-phosphate isomerase B [Paenibacillus naphthalenovorans]SDI22428.1 ribose 5-phosphate isomerase B [Paenibacillus naphthalenovorans]